MDNFQIVPVEITRDGQGPAPGKPTGSMPILEVSAPADNSEGRYIFQSRAILEYLEDVYGPPESGTPDMRGSTPWERATAQQYMDVLDEGVALFSFYVHNASKLMECMEEQSIEAVAKAGLARMDKMFDQLESVAATAEHGPWLTSSGEQSTIADCVAMATLQFAWEVYRLDLCRDRPKLRRVRDGFAQRESSKLEGIPAPIKALAPNLDPLKMVPVDAGSRSRHMLASVTVAVEKMKLVVQQP